LLRVEIIKEGQEQHDAKTETATKGADRPRAAAAKKPTGRTRPLSLASGMSTSTFSKQTTRYPMEINTA